MKPAIILFTTIGFILTISFTLLTSLNTNNKLLDFYAQEYSDSQALSLIGNIKEELGKYLSSKSKNDLVEIVNEEPFSLFFDDIKITILLDPYTNYLNINELESSDVKDFFQEKNLDYATFKEFIDNYKEIFNIEKIDTVKQVQQIIKDYSFIADDYEVLELFNIFSSFKLNDDTSYYNCFLTINIQGKLYKSNFIYAIENNTNEVVDFEIYL